MSTEEEFDPEVDHAQFDNVTPASTPKETDDEVEIKELGNKTGRNATYLAKRTQPFKDEKLENTVTIVAGEKYDNPFVQTISNQLDKGKGVTMTQEALEYLSSFAAKMKDGYQAAVPMTCLGEDCPYLTHCPLYKAKMELPIMNPCAVETHLFDTWVADKMIELDVDKDDPMAAIDRSQIREHAELEILQMRATLEMASDPETVKEKVVGTDERGNAILADVENARIGIIHTLAKGKRDILSDLVATRKERVKLGDRGATAAEAVAGFAAGAMKAKEKQLELEKKRIDSKKNERDAEFEEVNE